MASPSLAETMVGKEAAPAFEQQIGTERLASVNWVTTAATEAVVNPRARLTRAVVIARIRSGRILLAWERAVMMKSRNHAELYDYCHWQVPANSSHWNEPQTPSSVYRLPFV